MGLTVKRTTDLEKILGQFTNPATDAEEKKKKDKFLAKDKNQNKKGQKK
ncbi:SPJ_0845 family protein [Pediococcus acidilactici]